MAKNDTYKEVRIFTYPGWTIKVHIPDLTPAEREARMKILHNAAADLLREQEKKKNAMQKM